MRQITDVTRQDLFDIIRNGFTGKETLSRKTEYGYIDIEEDKDIYMPFHGRLSEIDFLERLYTLEDMPSKDSRYENAKGDIYCHTITFKDLPDFWFLDDERFELKDGFEDELILRFICEMVHPAVREEAGPWREYIEKFNELLRPDGYELYASYSISQRDVYEVRKLAGEDRTIDNKSIFSQRYKELIKNEDGKLIDNISSGINFQVKEQLVLVMLKFSQRFISKPDMDSFSIITDALFVAIKKVNEIYSVITLDSSEYFSKSYEEQLKNIFTPYLFDIIEFQFEELSYKEGKLFQSEINDIFSRSLSFFKMLGNGEIIQQIDYEVLDKTIEEEIRTLKEPGLEQLLKEAVSLHHQPHISAHKDAVEKIWDAFERLKTYYILPNKIDKKKSATKIINDISEGRAEFIEVFKTEFDALTHIGNNFRIRHHETDRFEIIDARYYDYFFNRCLSLIALAIQYLD